MNKIRMRTNIQAIRMDEDEVVRMKNTASFYYNEATLCYHTKLHPYLSGCVAISNAIHSQVLLIANARLDEVDNMEILPRIGSSYKPVTKWTISEAIRVAEYMAWLPDADIADATSFTSLIHIQDLLNPGYLMKVIVDDGSSSRYWNKKKFRTYLDTWLRYYRFLPKSLKQASSRPYMNQPNLHASNGGPFIN